MKTFYLLLANEKSLFFVSQWEFSIYRWETCYLLGKGSWSHIYVQNSGRWNYSDLASRRDSIYILGFYVLISFPSLAPYNLVFKIFKLKVKYLPKKIRLKWFQCNHMIHIHSIPSHFLLPSPLKPKYITPQNETVTCVSADFTSLADIYYKLNGNTHLYV